MRQDYDSDAIFSLEERGRLAILGKLYIEAKVPHCNGSRQTVTPMELSLFYMFILVFKPKIV
jgi:hypothetical protein